MDPYHPPSSSDYYHSQSDRDYYRPSSRGYHYPSDEPYSGRRYRDEDLPSRSMYRGYRDSDTPGVRRSRSRDPYDDRPRGYRSRSPVHGLDYDERQGFAIKGRNSRSERERDVSASQDRGVREQNDRIFQSRRQQRVRDPYSSDAYYDGYGHEPCYGEDDVSRDGQPMRLLLILDLHWSTTEERLARDLSKLDYSADSNIGATEGSLRRVFLIRDRARENTMGYGYAEYHTVDDAKAALQKAGLLDDKCTIDDKPVRVSFPHIGVFPLVAADSHRTHPRFIVSMPQTGQQHRYHLEHFFASELMINDQPASRETGKKTTGAALGRADAKEKKKKSKKSRSEENKSSAAAIPTLQNWQKQAAALREPDSAAADLDNAKPRPASGVNTIVPRPSERPSDADQQTFCMDTETLKCCYLCNTQLKTSEQLRKHIDLSAKHTSQLQSEESKKAGLERMKAKGVNPKDTIKHATSTLPPSEETPDQATQAELEDAQMYRDRAAERRKEEAHIGGQRVRISLKASSLKKPPGSEEQNEKPAAPNYGKGLNMLQKAGWSAGKGLGASLEGKSDVPDQGLYKAGVGLGHESSRMGDAVEEAERLTKGDRGGFLEKTKEVARMRFEGMK